MPMEVSFTITLNDDDADVLEATAQLMGKSPGALLAEMYSATMTREFKRDIDKFRATWNTVGGANSVAAKTIIVRNNRK